MNAAKLGINNKQGLNLFLFESRICSSGSWLFDKAQLPTLLYVRRLPAEANDTPKWETRGGFPMRGIVAGNVENIQ